VVCVVGFLLWFSWTFKNIQGSKNNEDAIITERLKMLSQQNEDLRNMMDRKLQKHIARHRRR
jgi:hypothetical protein